MTASLPTPLGPLMTMIKGFGVGAMGSELKEEPNEVSKARMSSERSALSTEGMETKGGRERDIWAKKRGVGDNENDEKMGLVVIRGIGDLKGKR
jgi:hypothetical protein